jgi:hypothetical protein
MMEDNFAEMVKGVMSDPDAMSKLMSMAEGLMGNGANGIKGQTVTEVSRPADLTERLKNSNEERIALISALRPFLSDTRRKNADNLIKMLKMMKLADMNKLLGSL